MDLTCAQKHLLNEENYTTCPGCKSNKAYKNFYGKWECPEAGCANFSNAQQKATYPQFNISNSPKLDLPSKEEWQELEQKANNNQHFNVWVQLHNGYSVSTAFIPTSNKCRASYNNHWETMVFKPNSMDEVDVLIAYSLDEAKQNHVELTKKWSLKNTP